MATVSHNSASSQGDYSVQKWSGRMHSTLPRSRSQKRDPATLPTAVVKPCRNSQFGLGGSAVTTEESKTPCVYCKKGFRPGPECNCQMTVCAAVKCPEYSLEFQSGDVMEDAYRGCTTVLAQVVDCVAVKSFGTSKVLVDKYPFSSPYLERRRLGAFNRALPEDRDVPGRITLHTSGANEHNPMVANLFAQFYPGKPFEDNVASQNLVRQLRRVSWNESRRGFNGTSRSDDHFLQGLRSDTRANRTRWFRECLGRMLDIPRRFEVQKVVFLYKAVSGFSLEDWEEFYVPTIRRFSDWVSGSRINVVVLNIDQTKA